MLKFLLLYVSYMGEKIFGWRHMKKLGSTVLYTTYQFAFEMKPKLER